MFFKRRAECSCTFILCPRAWTLTWERPPEESRTEDGWCWECRWSYFLGRRLVEEDRFGCRLVRARVRDVTFLGVFGCFSLGSLRNSLAFRVLYTPNRPLRTSRRGNSCLGMVWVIINGSSTLRTGYSLGLRSTLCTSSLVWLRFGRSKMVRFSSTRVHSAGVKARLKLCEAILYEFNN